MEQTTPGAAAPAAAGAVGAQPDTSTGRTAAAVAELAALRAKTPGVRFTSLPPSVSALLDGTGTPGAPPGAPPDSTTPANAGTPQDRDTPTGAATGHDVSTFAGDNPPVGDLEAMQARVGLAHRLQVADEIPGFNAGVANEYGKMLAAGLQNPPTRAQKLQAMAETARTLQGRYPNGKHEKVLADAQAELKLLAARIPELPSWLERTGGGNDVGIIIRLAERHAQRAAARIASAARGSARR